MDLERVGPPWKPGRGGHHGGLLCGGLVWEKRIHRNDSGQMNSYGLVGRYAGVVSVLMRTACKKVVGRSLDLRVGLSDHRTT